MGRKLSARTGILAALACTALLAAGCASGGAPHAGAAAGGSAGAASASGGGSAAGGSAAHSSAADSSAASGSAHGSDTAATATAGGARAGTMTGAGAGTPQQQAAAAARTLLAEFAVPPGATRLAGEPAGDQHELQNVAGLLSGAMVRDTSWWVEPSPAVGVLDWEKAHVPAQLKPSFGGFSGRGPSTTRPGPGATATQAFDARLGSQVSATLVKEYLVVSVTGLPGGRTGIRVDSDVSYQPTRPATEVVPPAVTRVTITLITRVSEAAHPRPPAPVTITDPAVVQHLIALVNHLPLSTALKDAPCPSGPPDAIDLVFRAKAGGPALAEARGPGACTAIGFRVNGNDQPDLSGVGPFAAPVIAIARLPWKLPHGG
ncbi:MAG TPA: hypothetical protein VH478_11785 [Trebonia sp.]|jgi:hypothetical protein|nr:hypothetical protein [Trebonia sp.]